MNPVSQLHSKQSYCNVIISYYGVEECLKDSLIVMFEFDQILLCFFCFIRRVHVCLSAIFVELVIFNACCSICFIFLALNVSVASQSEITRRMYNSTIGDADDAAKRDRALLSRSEIPHDEHPLSLGKTSVWNQFFQVQCKGICFRQIFEYFYVKSLIMHGLSTLLYI